MAGTPILNANEEPERPAGSKVQMAATKAPDGSWWIMITHAGGAMSFTYGIPLDSADQAADEFAANLHALAAEARRARAGIVVADATGVHPDGNRKTRRNMRG